MRSSGVLGMLLFPALLQAQSSASGAERSRAPDTVIVSELRHPPGYEPKRERVGLMLLDEMRNPRLVAVARRSSRSLNEVVITMDGRKASPAALGHAIRQLSRFMGQDARRQEEAFTIFFEATSTPVPLGEAAHRFEALLDQLRSAPVQTNARGMRIRSVTTEFDL